MQDEPGEGVSFSHKMSLKGRGRMLGIDHQHGRREKQGLEQIRALVEASEEVRFQARSGERCTDG